MPLLPVALYGLEVPAGDILVPALADFPATFRITMAAIDPSEEPELEGVSRPRSTLKIIRQSISPEDEDDDEYMRAMLGGSDSESDSDSDSEGSEGEANGGPSDPAKSKKAKKEAAVKELLKSLQADSDDEMEDAAEGVNGTSGTTIVKKGKAKATDENEDEQDSEDEDSDEDIDVEEFVLCTLDPEKNYQQALDFTIGEDERVFFKVSGTHTVYITGNYVIPDDDGHNHHHEVYDSEDDSESDEDSDVDLSPDEDELEFELDDESDELDGLDNPRVTEVDSDEEPPKLVKPGEKKAEKKGKNKRTADELEAATSLDDLISKASKPESAEEPKLSKKQLKKLKKNDGEAAAVKPENQKNGVAKDVTPAKSDKSDKKVQFAKNLEQGPTGSAEKPKPAVSALGIKKVKGVTVDDKKIGSGKVAKKGDKIGMRYIGKLENGKVFDSNKAGKPFSFKLGAGEVIKGWDIGVEGMGIGGERRLTIPANLAYGSDKLPGIPPNSTLIFDVKLLEIK